MRNAIDGGPYLLARDALEAGLVDGLVYNDELEERLEREAASLTENPGEPVQSAAWRGPRLPKVAVISAVGTILSGEIPPYQGIGSETLARAIRTAREDPSVDGILLRIDSGGGSALASEVIAREVALCREGPDAKPVAVSMAGVAASGGYMIAAAAERIFAGSGTITGSIGALAGILNFSALLEAQSIGIDSVTTADGADFASPLLPRTLGIGRGWNGLWRPPMIALWTSSPGEEAWSPPRWKPPPRGGSGPVSRPWSLGWWIRSGEPRRLVPGWPDGSAVMGESSWRITPGRGAPGSALGPVQFRPPWFRNSPSSGGGGRRPPSGTAAPFSFAPGYWRRNGKTIPFLLDFGGKIH